MTDRIAVLDDEPRMAEIIGMVLRREGYEVHGFTAAQTALQALEDEPFDLLMTDLRMPDMDGLDVLRRALEIDPELPVVLITAHGSVSSAIEAIRKGAFDYVEKPFDNDDLKAMIRRALDLTRLTRENRYLRGELKSRYSIDQVVAESDVMREALDLVARAARGRSTVLITGESGTGKELIARAVHYHSDRVGGPFLAVNCKSFAAGVLESELFGHEKGAFTGASKARPGVFEQAHGGTLFLDEIGEVDLDFQGKLLRTLQERVVRRVGGDQQHEVDTRIVAATNRDLKAEVEAGRFREDLFFRLAVIPIHLPPLRERRADILPLARHFLQKWTTTLDRRITGWNEDVERWMLGHDWPGNARELENSLERGVVLARGDVIELDDLLVDANGAEESAQDRDVEASGLRAFLDASAADRVRAVLAETGGKRVEAAARLGIDRTTLYRLMRRLRIE